MHDVPLSWETCVYFFNETFFSKFFKKAIRKVVNFNLKKNNNQFFLIPDQKIFPKKLCEHNFVKFHSLFLSCCCLWFCDIHTSNDCRRMIWLSVLQHVEKQTKFRYVHPPIHAMRNINSFTPSSSSSCCVLFYTRWFALFRCASHFKPFLGNKRQKRYRTHTHTPNYKHKFSCTLTFTTQTEAVRFEYDI